VTSLEDWPFLSAAQKFIMQNEPFGTGQSYDNPNIQARSHGGELKEEAMLISPDQRPLASHGRLEV
jgi:hypothetical protein